MDKMSAEYQRKVSEFVDREVIYCVSGLIYDLSKSEEFQQELYDENLLVQDDWQTPAEEAGWTEVDGEIVKRPAYVSPEELEKRGQRFAKSSNNEYDQNDLIEWYRTEPGANVEYEENEAGDEGFFYFELRGDDGEFVRAEPRFTDEDEAWAYGLSLNLEQFKEQYEEENQVTATSWQDACDQDSLDPDQNEVYEHWIVTNWFARKLEEKGETVCRDFHGLTIWGRTCTGQAISLDYVVCQIYDELHREDE